MKKISAFGLVGLMILFFPSFVLAQAEKSYTHPSSNEDNNLKLTTALTYERGDFGTSHDTETVYAPFSLTRYFNAGNVTLTVPYIYQKSPPSVSALRGRPFQINTRSGDVRTDSGIGDIL